MSTAPAEERPVEVSIPVRAELRAIRRAAVQPDAGAHDPAAEGAAVEIAAEVTMAVSDILLALAEKGIRLEGEIVILGEKTTLG